VLVKSDNWQNSSNQRQKVMTFAHLYAATMKFLSILFEKYFFVIAINIKVLF